MSDKAYPVTGGGESRGGAYPKPHSGKEPTDMAFSAMVLAPNSIS